MILLTGPHWKAHRKEILRTRPVITTKGEAFAYLKTIVDPSAPQAGMECALRIAYEQVPGFTNVYMDCVQVNGRWDDVVHHYPSPIATWADNPHTEKAAAQED